MLKIKIDHKDHSKVIIIDSSEILIRNVQDALDLMSSIQYNYESNKFVIEQSNLTEEFFELKTRLAGEILQKYGNYNIKIAIVGDFDHYNSKSLYYLRMQ